MEWIYSDTPKESGTFFVTAPEGDIKVRLLNYAIEEKRWITIMGLPFTLKIMAYTYVTEDMTITPEPAPEFLVKRG